MIFFLKFDMNTIEIFLQLESKENIEKFIENDWL